MLRYPPPFVDEAWLVSRAWAFKDTGRQFGMLDTGVIEQYAGYWTVNQWLITALQSQVLRLFDKPQLWALRILSLLEGFGLLLVSYWANLRLSGKTVAICSTLLLALSRIFFHTAHMVRYDILATFFGYAALALIINDRRGRFWSGLAAGVLVGLAIETHLNSIIFLPALGIYYFIEYRVKVFRKTCVWGFVLGTAIGLIFYLSLHVLPYPDTYRGVNSLLFSHTQTPALLSFDPRKVLGYFKIVVYLFLIIAGPLLLFWPFTVAMLASRGTHEAWQLLAINLSMWVAAALIFPSRVGHYAIYLAPAFMWLLSEFLVVFYRKKWGNHIVSLLSRAMLWGTVVGTLAITVMDLIPNNYLNYTQAQAQVNEVTLPKDVVMGTQEFWFGLTEHTYYSWELLFLYPRINPGKTMADAFEYYRPDLLVIDRATDNLISDTIDPDTRWYYYRLPRQEFYDYLAAHAHKVLSVDNPTYGEIQVYRFTWK